MTKEQILRAVFRSDPARLAADKDLIRLDPWAPNFSFGAVAAAVENWEFFEGILLAVCFRNGDTNYIEGSAVLVAPGVAVCATHIIAERLSQLSTGAQMMWCQGIASHGLVLWRVRSVICEENTDMTLLMLELAADFPPDHRFRLPIVSSRIPSIGETVKLCGFRTTKNDFEQSELFEGAVRVSQGPVTEIYLRGRDRAMLPWPCFEVDCPALGGMSGGPVFDLHDRLIGIVCSSIDHDDTGLKGTTYISMLWRALQIEMQPCWPVGLHQGPTSLAKMAADRCFIDRPEAMAGYLPGGPGYASWT